MDGSRVKKDRGIRKLIMRLPAQPLGSRKRGRPIQRWRDQVECSKYGTGGWWHEILMTGMGMMMYIISN